MVRNELVLKEFLCLYTRNYSALTEYSITKNVKQNVHAPMNL